MTATQPPAEAQARPEKPAECADGCPTQQVCDHCQWPPGPDAEAQAQGGGEVVYQLAGDFGREWLDCSEAEFKWWQGKDRKSRKLYTTPPSAPVGVEGVIAEMRAWVRAAEVADAGPYGQAWRTVVVQDFIAKLEHALAQQPAAVDGANARMKVVGRVARHIHVGGGEGVSVIWNDMPPAGSTLYALAAQPGGDRHG